MFRLGIRTCLPCLGCSFKIPGIVLYKHPFSSFSHKILHSSHISILVGLGEYTTSLKHGYIGCLDLFTKKSCRLFLLYSIHMAFPFVHLGKCRSSFKEGRYFVKQQIPVKLIELYHLSKSKFGSTYINPLFIASVSVTKAPIFASLVSPLKFKGRENHK